MRFQSSHFIPNFFQSTFQTIASRALEKQVHQSGSQGIVLDFTLAIIHSIIGVYLLFLIQILDGYPHSTMSVFMTTSQLSF